MRLFKKETESGYKKHLEHMETGYSDMLMELLYKKCRGYGLLEDVCSVVEAKTIEDLKGLNIEVKPLGPPGIERAFRYKKDEIIGLNPPVFIGINNCEWYENENSDKGGPTLLAILDNVRRYKNPRTPLRQDLLHAISREVYGVLPGSEREISFNIDGEYKDYIALPAEIWCEESCSGDKLTLTEESSKERRKSVLGHREEVLSHNKRKVSGLIDAAEKYTGITRGSVFQNEEQKLGDLPRGMAKLFASIDTYDVAAILENIRSRTNITVKL